MNNLPFTAFAALYLISAVKIDYWITISRLGFKSECPTLFVRKERIYHFTVWAFFVGAIASLFAVSFPLWIGIGILVFFWVFSGIVGRKKAFSKYREILSEMIDFEEDEERKTEYKNELLKTDSELLNQKT